MLKHDEIVYVYDAGVTPGKGAFDYESYLKDYKHLKKLGSGGFGSVFLAEHFVSKELFALKVIETGKVEEIESSFKETRSLTALSHRRIIKLHTVIKI